VKLVHLVGFIAKKYCYDARSRARKTVHSVTSAAAHTLQTRARAALFQ